MYITKSNRKAHNIRMLILIFLISLWVFAAIYALMERNSENVGGSMQTQLDDTSQSDAKFIYNYNDITELKDGKIDIFLENPTDNIYDMQIEIIDESDEIIYKSSVIENGFQLQYCTLQRDFSSGEHEVKMKVYVLNNDDIIGSNEHQVIINVE